MQNWNRARAEAWALFTPPARPSKGEVDQYRRLQDRYAPQARRWLLLGSTPEIRRLSLDMHTDLTAIDRNAEVFKILGRDIPGQPRTQFIESDWLHAEYSAADAVFADGSLNMLAPEHHRQFWTQMSRFTKPGGSAFVRIHLSAPPRYMSAQAMFSAFEHLDGPGELFTATRTHLDMLWIDRDRLAVDFALVHERLRALFDANQIAPQCFEAYDRLLRFNRITLYYSELAAVMELIKPWFHIECVVRGGDYELDEQHPIFCLRRQA